MQKLDIPFRVSSDTTKNDLQIEQDIYIQQPTAISGLVYTCMYIQYLDFLVLADLTARYVTTRWPTCNGTTKVQHDLRKFNSGQEEEKLAVRSFHTPCRISFVMTHMLRNLYSALTVLTSLGRDEASRDTAKTSA